MRQVETLWGPARLGHRAARDSPTILAGNFHAGPSSAAFKLLSRQLKKVQTAAVDKTRATFPAEFGLLPGTFKSRELLDVTLLKGTAVADDKSKVGKEDRAKAAAGQGYEVQFFTQKDKLTPDQIRDLIHTHGNDRKTLEREAGRLSGG